MITVPTTAAPVSTNDSFSHDRKLLKQVRDNVHGNIFLEPIFLKFVDTEQFQRLRDLRQLGLSHMVYPGAVHYYTLVLSIRWAFIGWLAKLLMSLKNTKAQSLVLNILMY